MPMPTATVVDLAADFPKKLNVLFEPHRYKVAYGGRGGVKSWSFARALLIHGTNTTLRILCTREIQKSIRESVHQLLAEQIVLMGLSDFYDVLDNEIRGSNGTEFIFAGLQGHTVTSIKSYESIDIAWVEEAQTVKKKSWEILIPTIRKEDSEIWITFNSDLDTDETYVRFVLNPPPGAVVVFLTWRDNPWFTDVLEAERRHCEQTNREDYDNIWEGKCRTSVIGAIFAKEVGEMIAQNRHTLCPYDPRLKVHTIWDMGWNDACSIGLVQRQLSECRIIGYLEGSFQRIDEWAVELNSMKLNWGWDYLPFDAYHTSRQTGYTDAQILKKCGRRVKPQEQSIPKHDPEVGIRAARQLLARTYLHKGDLNYVKPVQPDNIYRGTERLMECWKRYKRHVPKHGEPGGPVHDEYSHGADMTRHLAMVIDKLSNDDLDTLPPVTAPFVPRDRGMGALG